MYYIVAGGQIVDDSYGEPSQEDLQEWANDLNEHVYVIHGEHYGMTAEPQTGAKAEAAMHQKVTIKMVDRLLGSAYDLEVDADVKDGYAIHYSTNNTGNWEVTHVLSGIRCGSSTGTFFEAAALRDVLKSISVNGIPFADMPTCEAITVAPIVARDVARAIGADPIDATRTAFRQAAYCAKMLCEAEAA